MEMGNVSYIELKKIRHSFHLVLMWLARNFPFLIVYSVHVSFLLNKNTTLSWNHAHGLATWLQQRLLSE